MNCIFITIFNNENYIKMFYLLLEIILIFSNLNDNTDILIYTSTPFMNIIKNSHLFNDKIKFELNDNYNTVTQACKARLDLFKLDSISNYEKILYLDTDSIIKKDICVLFDLNKEDIMYTQNEGSIDHEWWGSILFGDEVNNYENKDAFTSGILLFNNCDKIKMLFEQINQDMIDRPHDFDCHDQPYIVYNAFKNNLFDNTILTPYTKGSIMDINSQQTIHHFCGGPGLYAHKLINMKNFLNAIKNNRINENIEKTKEYINNNLIPIINNSGELLEGNVFMYHQTTIYVDFYIDKAKNISNLSINSNIKNAMEIGFNSGFSALLMLISNPNLHVTCYDLGDHSYALPCYEKIKETFGNRLSLIIGDSRETLKTVDDTYDLIHIDGGHSVDVAENDIINSYRMSKQGTVIIMDDYNMQHLFDLWNKYINKWNLKPVDIELHPTRLHDVKYVNTMNRDC